MMTCVNETQCQHGNITRVDKYGSKCKKWEIQPRPPEPTPSTTKNGLVPMKGSPIGIGTKPIIAQF